MYVFVRVCVSVGVRVIMSVRFLCVCVCVLCTGERYKGIVSVRQIFDANVGHSSSQSAKTVRKKEKTGKLVNIC